MAVIRASTSEAVYKIQKFLGLNENPDGDTKLRLGEAAVCRNWKVTRDLNLQRRPGSKTIFDFRTESPVAGMWFGNIHGAETGLAASGNHLWKFYENGKYMEEPEDLGDFGTKNRVNFFAYSDIVYILNGEEYMQYDGIAFKPVPGYRPLIANARTPNGSQSTLLEEVNKLNSLRRVWFSPDGTSKEFLLPEQDLVSIDYVIINATGAYMSPDLYTKDRLNGKVTFDTAPAAGTNSIEIGYSAAATYRNDVSKMTNAEIFLGAQDNAVFLYGNGTNKAIYSGLDYLGEPRADYFPDMNEMSVADSNTPITALIRHYSQMLCFKSHSVYTVKFGLISTATGDSEYGFYVTPINKSIGNAALGQVRLVLNSPYALFGSDLYEWKNSGSYSSNLTLDERQAKRISDRIYSTLGSFDAEKCYCYDDNDAQEYYICCGEKSLVYNYAADAWYVYTGISINCMCNIYSDTLIGTVDGKILFLDSTFFNDDGREIDSYWESGSMDMGKNYIRKLMSEIWISMKPEEASKVTVTVQTDKKSEYTEKTIESSLSSFTHMNFGNFTFAVNRKPQVKKLKIKAKKFAFLKLIFRSKDLYTTATILSADPKVRETGYVK